VHRGRRITFPAFTPDVAHAISAALKLGRPGEVYNISGESLTHRQVNLIISRLAGISPWRFNVPASLMLALARAWTRLAERTGREPYYPINLAGYVFHDWRVSSAKAQAELDYCPTPFEDGARQTLEWYWASGLFRRPRRAQLSYAAKPAGE
jgi:dihydroflavonol-4-reductase